MSGDNSNQVLNAAVRLALSKPGTIDRLSDSYELASLIELSDGETQLDAAARILALEIRTLQEEVKLFKFHTARFLAAYAFLSGRSFEDAVVNAPPILFEDVEKILSAMN